MNTNAEQDDLLGEDLLQKTLHFGKVGIHALRPVIK